MADLRSKRVLVIGGETALGRALAVGLAEAGADVAIASLSNDPKAEFAVNSTLNELWALGRRGVALTIDASDAAQLRDAVARAEAELGGIDLAVVLGEEPGVAIDALREALAGRGLSLVQADAELEGTLRALLERI